MNVMTMLLSASVVALGSAYAGAAMVSYEGNTLPDDISNLPQWSNVTSSPAGSASVSSGVLTVSTTAATQSVIYRVVGSAGSAWNPTAGNTTVMDVGLKVISQVDGSARAGSFLIGTGTQAWLLRWGTNVISEELVGNSELITTNDAFHNYQFRIAGTEGPLEIYMDGASTPLASWAGVDTSAHRLDFGDTLDGDAGTIEWDYIRWDNNYVTAVPEPTVLSLAVFGLTALVRTRRPSRI